MKITKYKKSDNNIVCIANTSSLTHYEWKGEFSVHYFIIQWKDNNLYFGRAEREFDALWNMDAYKTNFQPTILNICNYLGLKLPKDYEDLTY